MKRKLSFSEGKTPDERLDAMDIALKRMSRNVYKTTTVVMPPIPFSASVSVIPEDGEIFRAFFVISGHISKIYAMCENAPKDTKAVIQVLITEPNGQSHASQIPIKKGLTMIDTTLPIPAGARVQAFVKGNDGVSGLWFSCLYDMDILDSAKQSLAIDDLMANADRMIEDARETKE